MFLFVGRPVSYKHDVDTGGVVFETKTQRCDDSQREESLTFVCLLCLSFGTKAEAGFSLYPSRLRIIIILKRIITNFRLEFEVEAYPQISTST